MADDDVVIRDYFTTYEDCNKNVNTMLHYMVVHMLYSKGVRLLYFNFGYVQFV